MSRPSWPGTRGVADNEVIIVRTASLAGKLVVHKPKARVRFPRVFEDVGWRVVPLWERRTEDVSGESLGPRR
jgi:hypothetical protein